MAARQRSPNATENPALRASLCLLFLAGTACNSIDFGQSDAPGSASISSVFSVGHMQQIDDASPLALFDFLNLPEASSTEEGQLVDAGTPNGTEEELPANTAEQPVCVLAPLDSKGTLLVQVATPEFAALPPGGCPATTVACGQVRVTAEAADGTSTFSGISDRRTVPLAIGDHRGVLTLAAELILQTGTAAPCSDCTQPIIVSDDCDLDDTVLTASAPAALAGGPDAGRQASAAQRDAGTDAAVPDAAVPDAAAPDAAVPDAAAPDAAAPDAVAADAAAFAGGLTRDGSPPMLDADTAVSAADASGDGG